MCFGADPPAPASNNPPPFINGTIDNIFADVPTSKIGNNSVKQPRKRFPETEMVSSPLRIVSKEKLQASIGLKMRISNPVVSKSGKYLFTFLIISLSWARFSSNQKTAGVFDKRARFTASFTQS